MFEDDKDYGSFWLLTKEPEECRDISKKLNELLLKEIFLSAT
jgi:hypothetical protein